MIVKINYIGGCYILEANQIVKGSLSDVWYFFSNAKNLEIITPKDMNFRITSGGDDKIYGGQIITYRIGLFNIYKTNWVTEITHIIPNRYFVDEQRFGPYKMWQHQHHFEPCSNGVRMYDKVIYKVPLGWLGRLANSLFIKKKLIGVFNYRASVINEFFGDLNSG